MWKLQWNQRSIYCVGVSIAKQRSNTCRDSNRLLNSEFLVFATEQMNDVHLYCPFLKRCTYVTQ